MGCTKDKGLGYYSVIKNNFTSFSNGNERVKTLVEQFDYPKLGAGQMYEAMCDIVVSQGTDLLLNTRVVSFNHKDNIIESIDVISSEGEFKRIRAKQIFNTIPLTHFIKMLNPPESVSIQKATDTLYYRDHITVNMLINNDDLFPDQWIYIHSPDVKMARLANYNNFSKEMIGRKNITALSVEYFVFQHEELWNKSDESLKALAVDELEYLGLVGKNVVEKSWVVRETECYPVYYIGFQEPYNLLKLRIDQFVNLYAIGRSGMYKYNNQDHSTMSGIIAARNYLKLHSTPYILWDINIDAEYHERSTKLIGENN